MFMVWKKVSSFFLGLNVLFKLHQPGVELKASWHRYHVKLYMPNEFTQNFKLV